MATEWLTRKEASAYLAAKGLKIAVETLKEYAGRREKREKGPKYHRFGDKHAPTYYKPTELDEWIEKRLKPAR